MVEISQPLMFKVTRFMIKGGNNCLKKKYFVLLILSH